MQKPAVGPPPRLTFTERVQRRYALWWGPLDPWWTLRGVLLRVHRRGLRRLHRADELLVMRRHTDPDRLWRFSRYWQRTLLNKFNSREFATRHRCRVPALYWCGRRIADLPVDSVGDSYVIRPLLASASTGVYVVVGDHELMSDTRLAKSELRDRLASELGEVAAQPILLEEFVRSPGQDRALPLEYKFHMFADRIAAIEVGRRMARKQRIHQQLDPNWEPFAQPIHTRGTLDGSFEPPACVDEMTALARRLGMAFGTYVRVDAYATDEGPIFSEFSSTPGGGNTKMTPFADEYFGRLWDEVYPHHV